jgi:hypothetical protein
VLPIFSEDSQYAITGRVAAELARVARARSAYERPWRPVEPHLEVEDWDLLSEGAVR